MAHHSQEDLGKFSFEVVPQLSSKVSYSSHLEGTTLPALLTTALHPCPGIPCMQIVTHDVIMPGSWSLVSGGHSSFCYVKLCEFYFLPVVSCMCMFCEDTTGDIACGVQCM